MWRVPPFPSRIRASVIDSDGGGFTVKLVWLVAVPAAVVTTSGPLTAPAGTVAFTVVAVTIVTLPEDTPPPNDTSVVDSRFVPLSVTTVPTTPLVGVMLV